MDRIVTDRQISGIVAVAAIAFLAYLAFGFSVDSQVFWRALSSVSLSQWLVLLLLSLANYLLRFGRWHAYLKLLDISVPVTRSLLIYLSGFAFTVTPGKIGESVRSLYLRSFGAAWSTGLAPFFIERLLDFSAILILSVLAMDIALGYGIVATAAVSLIAIGLLAVTRPQLVSWLRDFTNPEKRLYRVLDEIRSLLVSSRELVSVTRLSAGLALGICAWSAEGFGLYLLLHWLGLEIPLALAIGIFALSTLGGALTFLPGGLGGNEAIMIALLLMQDMALATAAGAVLVFRLVTLWFAVSLGFMSVLYLGRDG